jgi:hypothetical protein
MFIYADPVLWFGLWMQNMEESVNRDTKIGGFSYVSSDCEGQLGF